MMDGINKLYAAMNTPEMTDIVDAYNARHGVHAAPNLTVTDDERAGLVAALLADRVRGKTVVELGGGIGLLALHLSGVAKRVIVIEANPVWTEFFVALFYRVKPANVTWVFGAAEEVAGMVRGDVCLFCTHSDLEGMAQTAGRFAPEVIDVYSEFLGKDYIPRILRSK